MKSVQPIHAFLLLLLLGSCSSNDKSPTYFSGKSPDLKNDSVYLFQAASIYHGLESNNYIDKTMADGEGNFSFKVDKLQEGYYQVLSKRYPRLAYDIFISPGDSLYIYQSPWNADPKFEVSGRGSEKLAHLSLDHNKYPQRSEFSKIIRGSGFETAMDFKAFIDSIQEGRIALAEKQPVPDHIKSDFINDIKLESAAYLLEHLERRNYTMNGEFTYHMPDPAFYEGLDDLITKADFGRSKSKSILGPYLELKIRNLYGDRVSSESSNLDLKLDYISQLSPGKMKEELGFNVMTEFSMAMFEDNFFEEIQRFKEHMDSGIIEQRIKSEFDKNYSAFLALAPGAPAADFELPDEKGNKVRLSDFKGDIVYIDFWGTWCYPCIIEIPNSLKLQEEFREERVTFLYVALEADEEQIENWKKFIAGDTEQFKKFLTPGYFPGKHLVAEGQFNNPQLAPYKLNFAPTYVLIDQAGNFVDARADRPTKIGETIWSLLGKETNEVLALNQISDPEK